MKPSAALKSRGHELDLSPESFGEMLRSDAIVDDTEALRRRLSDEGYLYIPGFFACEDVLAARMEFLGRIKAYGGLDPAHPVEDAVASDQRSFPRDALLNQNEAVRRVIFSPDLMKFYERLLGGESRHSASGPGWRAGPGHGAALRSRLMGRGTHDVMTAWIPSATFRSNSAA